jgi:HD-GYP domain-containing protein (c-di-GMP phosphodiesterase class II)
MEVTQIQSSLSAESLQEVLKTKDQDTHAHTERVGELVRRWCEYMRVRGEWLDLSEVDLAVSARMHDIGKIGVRGSILNKAGPLTEGERLLMNEHVELGFELVQGQFSSEEVALGIRHHHERFDGRGYPSGLRGEAIPLFARVIAIVDAFDAMTSKRTYQRQKTEREALNELIDNAGSQFDPFLIERFVQFLHAQNQ